MNTKHRCLLLAGSVLALSLIASGCATTGTNSAPLVGVGTNGLVAIAGHEIQPKAMEAAIKNVSQAGTIAGLHYDQNSRSYFQAAEVICDTAIDNGNYDPAVLSQSLANISLKEARDPKVTAGIQSAMGLYSMFFGSVVTAKIADVSPYAVPALTGLRDGIAAGLALSPPPLPLPVPAPTKVTPTP